jgi:hypothetical protein
LQILQVFPVDIAEKPLNQPVNPCKHLQYTLDSDVYAPIISLGYSCIKEYKEIAKSMPVMGL